MVDIREETVSQPPPTCSTQAHVGVSCTHSSLHCPHLTSAVSERLGHNESSSSKKITQGMEFLARWNTCRTARSLSPTYYVQSGKLQQSNSTLRWLHRLHHLTPKVSGSIRVRVMFSDPLPVLNYCAIYKRLAPATAIHL